MKKILLTIATFISISYSIAQAPEGINYQAVVRDASGNVITNQNVSYQISILQGSTNGSAVYVETHNLATNDYGLTNFQIGNGTVVSGTFNQIDWSADSYFVKIELDENGGSNYTTMGTSQLMSVPYALHAKTAENVPTNISELNNDAGYITNADDSDADPTNELQDISLSGTDLSISNGSTVDLSNAFNVEPSSSYTNAGTLNTAYSNLDNTFQPVGPAISINKNNDSTFIEAFFNSTVAGGTFANGANGVILEIRVDGIAPAYYTRGVIKVSDSSDFLSFMSVFENLPAGPHTIQTYAKTFSGTSTNFLLDPGGWFGRILIKETK